MDTYANAAPKILRGESQEDAASCLRRAHVDVPRVIKGVADPLNDVEDLRDRSFRKINKSEPIRSCRICEYLALDHGPLSAQDVRQLPEHTLVLSRGFAICKDEFIVHVGLAKRRVDAGKLRPAVYLRFAGR